MSGLSDYIHDLIGHIRLPVHGLCPSLYTDAIYQLTPNITPRIINPGNDNDTRMNIRMSGLREYEEHLFADFKTLFAIYNQPFRNRMLNNGHHFRRMLMVSFFVFNCYYCIHGTHGRNFNIFPVTLEQYIPLDEVLTFATELDLTDTYDFSYGLGTGFTMKNNHLIFVSTKYNNYCRYDHSNFRSYCCFSPNRYKKNNCLLYM